MEEQGQTGQPAPTVGQTRTQDGENVAGGGRGLNSVNEVGSLASARPGEKIIHAKATRYIAATHGLNVWGLEYLAALEIYLSIKARENIGVEESAFIDWTGARGNWKKRMKEGSKECGALGLVDRFPFGPGHCIDLSHKGRRVLVDYGRRFEEIRADIEGRIAVSRLKNETQRLRLENMRRQGEARAAKELLGPNAGTDQRG